MPIFALDNRLLFPPVHFAEPDGLLAVGGDLSRERLLLAYRSGIFPWYNPGDPLLWHAPDPRFVLYPEKLHVPKSLRSTLRKERFRVTFDRKFAEVMHQCRLVPRPGQRGTWITDEMEQAYQDLHEAGYAHSVEVWEDQKLVGGLYGIAMGQLFCGESMFTHVSNASKVGFVTFVRWARHHYGLIDSQIYTAHLARFGAEHIPRARYQQHLADLIEAPSLENWEL